MIMLLSATKLVLTIAVMLSLNLQVLSLLILAQVWLSRSQFVFELELDLNSVTANFNCDDGLRDSEVCTTYFSIFCLREGRDPQSINTGDCPLGSSGRLNVYDQGTQRIQTRRITSPRPWPVRFQLYIKAKDSDPEKFVVNSDEDLDDIFIDRTLVVNTSFTEMEEYTGNLKRVTLQMRFRVMCQQNHYGADCSIFCLAQNDDVNGHYTCNSDGSIQCLEGFENPNNNCLDVINPCDSSPCANDGSCTPVGPFDFTCQCIAGYIGPTCEVNIDDCVSATCLNNSMCVDGIDSYECVCNPNFELDGGKCVQITQTDPDNQGTTTPGSFMRTTIPGYHTGTGIIGTTTPGPGSFTEKAVESGDKTSPTTVMYYYGVAIGIALIVILFIIFTMVLIVVIIKRRRKKTHCLHQEGNWMNGRSTELSTKVVDNPTYGQLSSGSVIYETPKRTSLEATVFIVDNPIYGEGTTSDNDGTIHDVQNPIYGDSEEGRTQQDQLYTIPKLSQAQTSLGDGENGPGYDQYSCPWYNYASLKGEVDIKDSSVVIQATHGYATVDKGKKTKNQTNTAATQDSTL